MSLNVLLKKAKQMTP